jgi:hypothetical protein
VGSERTLSAGAKTILYEVSNTDQIMFGCIEDGVEMAVRKVVVPGGDVEILIQTIVIEAIVPMHGVGGDELPRVGSRHPNAARAIARDTKQCRGEAKQGDWATVRLRLVLCLQQKRTGGVRCGEAGGAEARRDLLEVRCVDQHREMRRDFPLKL